MALIEVEDARKRFGDIDALAGVSIAVEAGECLALIGESGSGKTTLLRSINGLTELDSGDVRVRGEAVREADSVTLRRSIGYVRQDGGLIPHWTALRNAALVPTLVGHAEPAVPARESLAAVGLDPNNFGSRYPRELSGGQRQRVAIARAVAAAPDILLLDEPFGALDAITRADVQAVFAELRQATGVTAVFVTHDLREALTLATHVAVMQAGEIADQGPVDSIRASGHPYVIELVQKAGVGP